MQFQCRTRQLHVWPFRLVIHCSRPHPYAYYHSSATIHLANMQSDVCRLTNGTMNCQRSFLNAFNISAITFADITASNVSSTSATSVEQYQQFIGTTFINNSLVRQFSSALLIFPSSSASSYSSLSASTSTQPSTKFFSVSSSSMPVGYSQRCA